ncbi:myoneurin-like isoform X25 [Maniola hyperantus]|uniref:myoneurin-like isoform X25 n=1 Tax=Aphantopus hyperantus TaxID=2795564 RepID=UPI001569B625|nr:gastrula zinc finger protein XlCGF26.1-like isoform X19 [Maniola hyperantus]
MEGVLSDGMCRCCATEGSFKDFQVAYQWMGVEEIYGNMLKDCFDITLSVSEEISNGGICEVCITQLRNACNFKQQVQRTEEKFQKKLQEASFKTEGIKMEISRFEDDDSNISADDFSSPEYEVPIKVEKVEEKPKKRAAAKASTSKAKKTKASEGEPSVKRKPRESRRAFIKLEERSPVKKEINVRKEKIIKIVINKVGVSEKQKEADQHQNNIKEILLNTNATPIRCRLGIGYACCFCKEQFPDPADLKTHTIQHHTAEEKSKFMKGKDMHGYFVKLDITDFKCNLCKQNIDNIEDVSDHLKKVHDKKMFTNLRNHILPFKFSKESLSCCICYNIFNSFKALQEHMNIHYRNYVCTVCNAGFVNRNILLRHGDAHKTGDFSCLECSKTFDTARKKRLHDRAKHSGQKLPHKCGYCTERFKEVWKKYEHLTKIHGIKGPTINCRACDKSFVTKHAWRLHTTRVHLMQKYHKCTDCDMEFHTKKELESHMVRHTGTREFTCDICFKSYGRQKTMRDHVRRVHS